MAETIKTHLEVQAAISRSKGDSPGRCENCDRIIVYGETYGICLTTEVLFCNPCRVESTEPGEPTP